jgi:hypothetical protein
MELFLLRAEPWVEPPQGRVFGEISGAWSSLFFRSVEHDIFSFRYGVKKSKANATED